mgnify:CR=1 FL=1
MANRIEEYFKNKSILIPGGAGFIGSRLMHRLCSLGAKVTIVDSFEQHCGANFFHIRDKEHKIRFVQDRIENFLLDHDLDQYSSIVNCCGLTNHHVGFSDPDLDYRINCGSGLALLQKLCETETDCRLISFGSRNQYGLVSSPVSESKLLNPLDIQSVHKTTLEYYHHVYAGKRNLSFAFLRLTNTYGPGQRMAGEGIGFAGEIIKRSLDGEEIVIYGSGARVKDLLFIEDVVDAVLFVMMTEHLEDGVYNVGGKSHRVSDLIESIEKYMGKIQFRIEPFPEHIRNLDVGDAVMNVDRIKKETGWFPKVSLDEGIAATLGYYQTYREKYW